VRLPSRTQLAGTVVAVDPGWVFRSRWMWAAATTQEAAEDLGLAAGVAVTVRATSTEEMLTVDD
jgi:molybdopterin-binding protein